MVQAKLKYILQLTCWFFSGFFFTLGPGRCKCIRLDFTTEETSRQCKSLPKSALAIFAMGRWKPDFFTLPVFRVP